jgi:hypothetical protein
VRMSHAHSCEDSPLRYARSKAPDLCTVQGAEDLRPPQLLLLLSYADLGIAIAHVMPPPGEWPTVSLFQRMCFLFCVQPPCEVSRV